MSLIVMVFEHLPPANSCLEYPIRVVFLPQSYPKATVILQPILKTTHTKGLKTPGFSRIPESTLAQ